MADITITTAQNQVITIEFHRTAAKCWHVVFPPYVDVWRVSAVQGDYTYTGPNGGAVLASGSLERAMSAAAEQITRTEY